MAARRVRQPATFVLFFSVSLYIVQHSDGETCSAGLRSWDGLVFFGRDREEFFGVLHFRRVMEKGARMALFLAGPLADLGRGRPARVQTAFGGTDILWEGRRARSSGFSEGLFGRRLWID